MLHVLFEFEDSSTTLTTTRPTPSAKMFFPTERHPQLWRTTAQVTACLLVSSLTSTTTFAVSSRPYTGYLGDIEPPSCLTRK